MFKSKQFLGLDIGEHNIKLTQIQKKRGAANITTYGSIATPPGTVSGGLITDPVKLGKALAELVESLKLSTKDVVSAVSGQQVFTKLLNLPPMKHRELRQAAFYQASSFLPINIEEVTSDIIQIRDLQDEEGTKTELFFIAARRTQVDSLYLACKEAGLNLTAVEIEPLALQRVYAQEVNQNATVALLNIGGARTYLVVFNQGNPIYMRTVTFGVAETHQQEEDEPPSQTDAAAILQQETAAALENSFIHPLAELIPEITRSLDYFELQNKDLSISKIILCGGGSLVPGVEDYLSRYLNHPVELGQLDSQIQISRRMDKGSKDSLHREYSVALGLAMRGSKPRQSGAAVINLLNYRFAAQQNRGQSSREYLVYFVILLLLLGAGWGYNKQLQQKVSILKQDNEVLQKEVAQLEQVADPQIEAVVEGLALQRKLVEGVTTGKILIDPHFLEFVYHIGQPDITLSRVDDGNGVLTISALTQKEAAMWELTNKLKEDHRIQDILTINSKLNEQTGEIEFSLTLRWEAN